MLNIVRRCLVAVGIAVAALMAVPAAPAAIAAPAAAPVAPGGSGLNPAALITALP